MTQSHRTTRLPLTVAVAALAANATLALAGGNPIVYSESSSGDLSNSQAAPTAVSLLILTSQVNGSVGGADSQDFLTVTVPAGYSLTGYTNSFYRSTDGQGFTGVASGPTFSGNVFTPSSYLGYAHFGTSARNGSLPTADLVGVNLLPLMADNLDVAAGAQGFGGTLPAGTYTFLIQQLGATTEYSFVFQLTAVPAPSAAALLGIGGLALARRRR